MLFLRRDCYPQLHNVLWTDYMHGLNYPKSMNRIVCGVPVSLQKLCTRTKWRPRCVFWVFFITLKRQLEHRFKMPSLALTVAPLMSVWKSSLCLQMAELHFTWFAYCQHEYYEHFVQLSDFSLQHNGEGQSGKANRRRVSCCFLPACHSGLHRRPFQLWRRRQRHPLQHLHAGPAALLHGNAPVPPCSHQKCCLCTGSCFMCIKNQNFGEGRLYGTEKCSAPFDNLVKAEQDTSRYMWDWREQGNY